MVKIGPITYPICGVGFVITKELNLTGLDLDDCINSAGISPQALEILTEVNSYAETSPSGHGLRILAWGTKPGKGCKGGEGNFLEMYNSQRYITLTGQHLAKTPTTIEPRQTQIDELYTKYLDQPKELQSPHMLKKTQSASKAQKQASNDSTFSLSDEELLEKARNAHNGTKFSSLWTGQWEGLYRSQSEAELALCSILAFWTNKDAPRIDSLFRQSGLYRPKWAEKHGTLTYGEITIDKAIATVTTTYQKHRKGEEEKTNGRAETKKAQENKQAKKRQEAIATTASAVYIGEKGEVIPGIAAEYFIAQQADNLMYYQESFWRYKAGVWLKVDDKKLRQEIATMLGKPLAKKNVVEDILYLVTAFVFTDQPGLFDKNSNLLNFRNGMLDITTEQLLPHSRSYFSTIQFPFDCPLDAIREQDTQKRTEILRKLCPTWFKFLSDLELLPETYTRLAEWGGYCLTQTTRIEKCLYLKGEGANGKSTFLEGILSVLRLWASELELSQLFDKFKLSEIQGKLVNIATDIDTGSVVNPMFKKLVSGEEVEAERKFKNPFRFRPFCKFMFSANDFIPTKDRSLGFFRRFDVIEFKKQFPEATRDESVKETIKSGGEAQGIFCWMYFGLKHLIENRWKMTPSKEFEETKREFEVAANPLRQFIEECCLVEKSFNERGEPVHWVSAQILRQKYVEWCREKGYEVLAESKLGREIKRLGLERHQKRTPDGKEVWVYWGIAFIL